MAQNSVLCLSILLFCFGKLVIGANDTNPHIIIIVADDLGWNDVGFHGSNQIPTPNIDALAYNGVILNNHYTGAVCTPSRAALLTGKYPINLGMQHLALEATEPRGLPLTEKLLPQYLKEEGYATHIVGKWHLGFYKKEYTPTFRGFDSHFGYWSGHQDYYNHEFESSDNYRGYDMRRNMSVSYETKNRYSTDLYTEETIRLIDNHNKSTPMFIYLAHAAVHSGNSENLLQAPDEEVAKFSYISDPERRKYAAMVSKLDESVGEVVAALRRREMLGNSIILFVSDNGAPTFGPHHNAGSNYPFRGMKTTAWEGAVHCVAAIWSPLINQPQRISNQLFHMSDWLPTLISAAGINTTLPSLDGFNMWPTITDNDTAPRTEVLINIDGISNYSAIRSGDFKYVVGYPGRVTGWYGNLSTSGDVYQDYQPENVLRSKAGVAMIGLLTERQLSNSANNVPMLTHSDIRGLRSAATLSCGVAEGQEIPCDPTVAPCLFNLEEDPCEMINIAGIRPEMVQLLEESLEKHMSTALPAANIPGDIKGDPVRWKGLWVNWQDPKPAMTAYVTHKTDTNSLSSSTIIIAILGCILVCTVVIIIILVINNRRKSSHKYIDITHVGELKGSHL
ncbi:arylsulfatase B-like [Diachasmimorpha longicaudata]|uniref:arylsulfatase B-like n=1 Tax=Diachasmimorpha longicaudata TaxID=58733 RepID=UPI0030B8A648